MTPFLTPHSLPSTYRVKRGFTLYYAVLTSSILLLIGASILNLSLKEFLISSLVRESEYAFFAADSGAECALYWDLKLPLAFATFSTPPNNTTRWGDMQCNGFNLSGSGTVVTSSTAATSTFYFNTGVSPKQYCAVVRVIKNVTALGVDTTVDSRGYNYDCATNNSRKVERALLTKYPRAF